MAIVNHWWNEARRVPTPKVGSETTPRFIVVGSSFTYGSADAVAKLSDAKEIGSAHFLIGRNQTQQLTELTQFAPVNVETDHCGHSTYRGYGPRLDRFAVNVLLVNAGYAKQDAQGRLVDMSGHAVAANAAPGLWVEADSARAGAGKTFWQPFHPKQLDALEALIRDLVKAYPTLEAVVGRDAVDADGWRVDPGPAFPLQRFRQLIPNTPRARKAVVVLDGAPVFVGPGPSFKVGDALARDAAVAVIAECGDFLFVNYDATCGYVLRHALRFT